MRLAVLMNDIRGANLRKDTSLGILHSAGARGWPCWYIQPHSLMLQGGQPWARAARVQVDLDADAPITLGEPRRINLCADIDCLLMRQDPPVDELFCHATRMADFAARGGTLVLNNPATLRDCNEKLFAAQFPQFCPPLMVGACIDSLRAFCDEHGEVIFKPLDGMGGRGIFRVRKGDPNLPVILEMLTEGGQAIMAQGYLPAIAHGDRRVFIVDGQVASHCLSRVPARGQTRGNLAAGAKGRVQGVSAAERRIALALAERMQELGLVFVGLDIIGERLTEINITSPTGAREIDAASDADITGQLLDAIAKRHGRAGA